jgi:hypothetical protein
MSVGFDAEYDPFALSDSENEQTNNDKNKQGLVNQAQQDPTAVNNINSTRTTDDTPTSETKQKDDTATQNENEQTKISTGTNQSAASNAPSDLPPEIKPSEQTKIPTVTNDQLREISNDSKPPIKTNSSSKTKQETSSKKSKVKSRSRSSSSSSGSRKKSKRHSKKRSRSRSNSKKRSHHQTSSSKKRSRSRSRPRYSENRKRSRSRSKSRSNAKTDKLYSTSKISESKSSTQHAEPSSVSNNHIKNFLQHMKSSQSLSKSRSESTLKPDEKPRSNLIEIKMSDESINSNGNKNLNGLLKPANKKNINNDNGKKTVSDYLIEDMFHEEKQQNIDLNNIKLPESHTETTKDKEKCSLLDQRLLELFGKNSSSQSVKTEKVLKPEVKRFDSPSPLPLVTPVASIINTASSSAQASVSTLTTTVKSVDKVHEDFDVDDDAPYDPEKEYELDDIKECEKPAATANGVFQSSNSSKDFKMPQTPPIQSKTKSINKDKLKENIVNAAKNSIKPFYLSKKINKNEYKDVMRKVVNKVWKKA